MPAASAEPIGPTDPDDVIVPLPTSGRCYTGRAVVRLGEVSPEGRLRLDALARFVQDVSNDDTVDAGLEGDMSWVVRRTVVEVHADATLREILALTTFCGGIGGRWAERRVSIRGEHGSHAETATLWVHLDSDTGRPRRLPQQFHDLYAEAAAGRTIRAKLRHGEPPVGSPSVSVAPWPLRFTDFDVLGHVNNAVSWAALEEELATRVHLRAPMRAEVEYRSAIERDDEVVRLVVDHLDGGLSMWLADATDHRRVFTSARAIPLSGTPAQPIA